MGLFYKSDTDTLRLGPIVGAVLAVLVALPLLLGAVGGLKKTPRDQIGLSYGGGIFEGAHFQGVVQPGHSLFENGMGDNLYLYPVTQRNYIISAVQGEGDENRKDLVTAPSADRIPIQWQVAVYFKLNTNDAVLQKFHETIGLKYAAWTDEGWIQMLRDTFRPQIEYALQRETRRFDAASIYADPTTLQTIQGNIGSVLKDNVNRVLGGDYFCGVSFVRGNGNCPDFTFTIKAVTLPKTVVAAFEANRTSEIAVQTKKNEVQQAEFQAQAIEKLNAALSAQHSDEYVLLQAIKSGKITFWVIPSSNHLTLTKPAP